VDGAGKSMFGDELAQTLASAGRSIIRASIDGFHNPRTLRYRLGRQSPQGYFTDSYDYDWLKAILLDPLSPGGMRRSLSITSHLPRQVLLRIQTK
jgi:uridine kinase